nr:mytiporin 25 [Mytilus galloprovincialis]
MLLKESFVLLALFIQLQVALPNNLDKYNLEDAARKAEVEEVDLDNLMETNDGFHNLTNLGVPKTRVIGIISAVTAGFSVLKAVASQIDVSRVCAIGLSNHGNRKLVEPSWYLESGIIRDPLPREILPGDAGIFTFEKTNYATYGTAGTLTYTVEGTDTQIEVMWSVPMVYGVYSNRFNVQIEENQVASSMLHKFLYNNQSQEVSNGGHWMHRNHNNIKVHAAMTNNAKASLLVEIYYNLTTPITEVLGK